MFAYWVLLCLLGLAAAVDYESNESVQRFREYIRVNTTSNNDLTPAIEFWQARADEAGVPMTVLEIDEGFPILTLRWVGTNSSLNSIMLNSHMDVVPAEADEWTYPPFSAYLDDDGVIWGRGTQDMKAVGFQYYEALRRIKENNVTLLRDVYMTLMPDEEIGSLHGMQKFVKSEEFANMNVGFEMDEGSPYNLPLVPLIYQDQAVWQIQVDCYEVGGHTGLSASDASATGKCRNFMNYILDYKDEQYQQAVSGPLTDYHKYTTVSLNIMTAGYTVNNIVPDHARLVFDIRLGSTTTVDKFDAKLKRWIRLSGDDVTLTYILKEEQSPATVVNVTNPYYTTAAEVFTEIALAMLPIAAPGATDGRFVRSVGIPAFGVSFMPNTEALLHSVDERLSAETFLDGIEVYVALVPELANISADRTGDDPSVFVTKAN